MSRINGYTPKQLAHDIALGWLREVYADRTGDLSGLTESRQREVKVHIARLHDRLLSESGLDGSPLIRDDGESWMAQGTRRNVDGKPDYPWTLRYANGRPFLYASEEAAYRAAARACADTAHGLHSPRATRA